jgi:release factor glutamine methyltransferase
VDCSTAALDVARANAARHGAALRLQPGDWWQAVPGQTFDLAVSNPPYIAAHDPHLAALASEPLGALVSGADGLDALRTVASGAPRHLAPGGWLLVEHGFDQASAVRQLLSRAGLVDVATRQDLAGRDRCTAGRRPPEAHRA